MNMYDFIFITNVPAFYKVNLFNKLAEKSSIKVIFIARTSAMRDGDFYDYNHNFDSEYVYPQDFEQRNPLTTLLKIYKIVKQSTFKKLVFPGWEIKELIFLALLCDKRKNAVVIESSIKETVTSGYIWQLKKIFLNSMGSAYPSGELQKEILDQIGFKGQIFLTHGVGIPNHVRGAFAAVDKQQLYHSLKYLYVGRLSAEKNLTYLIEVFNLRSETLVIVGSGPEEEKLKKIASSNIQFLGYINNKALAEVYRSSDVFVLPSKSEPWGVVIEEALSFGLPVIVSDKVGCKNDLVAEKNGLVFDFNQPGELEHCMDKMMLNYSCFRNNVLTIDMNYIYERQVNSYLLSLTQ